MEGKWAKGQTGKEKQIVVNCLQDLLPRSAHERDHRDLFMIGGNLDAFFATHGAVARLWDARLHTTLAAARPTRPGA